MQIVVEPSGYRLGNLGDAAMLQASFVQLRGLWPAASISVVTSAPQALERLCPGAAPLPVSGRRLFLRGGGLFGPQIHQSPDFMRLPLLRWERKLLAAKPSRARQKHLDPHEAAALERFASAVGAAKLFLVSGAGGLTDAFKPHALTTLDLLGWMASRGVPCCLLGQGVGPIEDPELIARARDVLPRASLIGLREGRVGPGLLTELGVEPKRMTVTGDDAIEAAYQRRPASRGDALGVNLREADYSALSGDDIEMVRDAIHRAAQELTARLLPAPISHKPNSSDPDVIRRLLDGDGGDDFDAPEKIIDQIGRCRLVVTGSYHAAVFALAQGIPAIGLARSPYYEAKFLGLSERFGAACFIVRLGEPHAGERLKAAITAAWREADSLRDGLLQAAQFQIAASRAAYQRLKVML